MSWQVTPYTAPQALSTVVAAALTGYSLVSIRRRGRDPTLVAFAALMVSITAWSGVYLVQLSAVPLAWKVSLYRVTNAIPCFAAVFWLAFAAAYTDTNWLLDRRVLAAVASGPFLYVAVGLPTDPLHGLIVDGAASTIAAEASGKYVVLDRAVGPWYWFNTAWIYVLMLAGIVLVFRMVFGSRKLYRGQSATLVAAALVPFAVNVVHQSGLLFDPNVRLTSLTFSMSGVLFGVAVFRYELLDLVPVARDTVIDSMRDGYLVLDDEGRVVDSNPAARSLLDVGGDVVGERAGTVFPREVDVFADQSGGLDVGEFVSGTGEDRRYIEVESSPLSDDGRSIGRLVTLRDVTGRRAVEKRYQALIEHSSDVVAVLDPDGTVQYMSPSTERVIGHDPDEMVGENSLEYVHPDDRQQLATAFAEGARDPGWTARIEYQFRDGDDEWRTIESVATNLLDDPNVSGIVVNSRDVTDRKERERELAEKNERLEEFASVVSHDLRNPLGVAKGYLEVAPDDPDTYLPEIETSLDRMEAIIGDVLALARQGDDVGETVPVDLATVAREAWETVETPAATLAVDGDRRLQADPDRLKQLFENLYRNAVEHAGDDVTVRVGAIDATGTGNGSRGFYVADDGPGIPADHREDVLDSGFTTAAEGTGFGLAIVDRIAEAHDWSVDVAEGTDGGARFEIATGAAEDQAVAE